MSEDSRLIMSPTIGALTKALVAAQAVIKPIGKAGKVDFTNKAGKRTNYNYATYTDMWEAGHNALMENGLDFSILPMGNEVIGLMKHTSGEFLGGYLTMHPANNNSPQDVGSWVTYLSKYLYRAALNLPTDDDDAHKVTKDAPVKEITTAEDPLYVSLSKADGVNMDVATVKTFLATKGYKNVEEIKKAGKTSDESKAIILSILRGDK